MTDSVFFGYYELLLAVALGMARIYPVAYMVPAFCFQHVHGLPRHAIVFALAMVPAPGIREALVAAKTNWLMLGGLMFKEIVLGLMLGVLLAIPFWLYESVGALLDNQRGALIGGQLNPALGSDATPLGHLFKEMTVLLLMATLGISALVQVVWDSYLVWPPTTWFPMPAADGFDVFLGLIAQMFSHMILYAAPFIALLLLVEFGMAVLSLYSPQLQVFILAMPAKSLIGLAFLLFYLPTLWDAMTGSLSGFADIAHMLKLLLRVP
jgi:type III secretion protein T